MIVTGFSHIIIIILGIRDWLFAFPGRQARYRFPSILKIETKESDTQAQAAMRVLGSRCDSIGSHSAFEDHIYVGMLAARV